MKNIIPLSLLPIIVVLLLSFKPTKNEPAAFDNYFEKNVLRIDFELVGDLNSETFVLKQLKKQNNWAGPNQIINKYDLDLGTYRFLIHDSVTNVLLYKYGFCSLFSEWQTTVDAKMRKESYYHVNMMPFPKKTIKYTLEKRKSETGEFYVIHNQFINPRDYHIIQESPERINYSIIQGGNNVDKKIDIAFVAEGYSNDEIKKFNRDVERIWDYIASIPPFDSYKDKFNIYAVASISDESGTDIPGKFIFKNTILNSSFYTFDTPRYITTKDLKALHDIAAIVPYDQLFVLINSKEYGGGGFYNYYSATTSDNAYSEKVALHEFGHGFAGLADEYYDSNVAYEGYYNLNIEPWEPNITTLVSFEKKWKEMVPQGIKIPTERTSDLRKTIGVYEGGGYSSKGIYSPYQDCRMKSNVPDSFCPVCSKAIIQVIEFYTQ